MAHTVALVPVQTSSLSHAESRLARHLVPRERNCIQTDDRRSLAIVKDSCTAHQLNRSNWNYSTQLLPVITGHAHGLDLNEARDDGVFGCSATGWTMSKQSAPRSGQITTPAPHHSMFTGRMLFLTPSQQCQSTESRDVWLLTHCYLKLHRTRSIAYPAASNIAAEAVGTLRSRHKATLFAALGTAFRHVTLHDPHTNNTPIADITVRRVKAKVAHTRLPSVGFRSWCNVNVEFKVTLHEQVRYRGTLQYLRLQLQSITQPNTMVNTMVILVLGSQPTGDVSHKPGARLPLLSARPAVTLATL